MAAAASIAIEEWLAVLRTRVADAHPESLALFDVFAGEARFGRHWLDDSLAILSPGAPVLEVGAGLMLLSCQLCREGFDVTALEPIGEGFSVFATLQVFIYDIAKQEGCAPRVLDVAIEHFDERERYSFAYSMNVMEHVMDVPEALLKTCNALAPGGRYRFTCPNYWFPYEPHFNMPTLFSKALTERVFDTHIHGCTTMDDPAGLWRSLNWISVPTIRQAVGQNTGIRVTFRQDFLVAVFVRVCLDPTFAGRRSRWMRFVAKLLVGLHLHRLLIFIPVVVQPVIDCQLAKKGITQFESVGVDA